MSEEPKLSPEVEKRWQSNKPVPMKFLKMVVDVLIDQMLDTEEALNSRIDMLEESATRYRGVHDKSAQYNAGDMVTCKGGLWFAEKSTRGVPGTPNSGFKLMHKTPVARGNRT